jgi:hypothetical protein
LLGSLIPAIQRAADLQASSFLDALQLDAEIMARLETVTSATMLVPDNDAVARFVNSGKTLSTTVINNHIFEGTLTSAVLLSASSITAWSGNNFSVTSSATNRRRTTSISILGVEKSTTLTTLDIYAGNGVAHIGDGVLEDEMGGSIDENTIGADDGTGGDEDSAMTLGFIVMASVGSAILLWLLILLLAFVYQNNTKREKLPYVDASLYDSDQPERRKTTMWSSVSAKRADFIPTPIVTDDELFYGSGSGQFLRISPSSPGPLPAQHGWATPDKLDGDYLDLGVGLGSRPVSQTSPSDGYLNVSGSGFWSKSPLNKSENSASPLAMQTKRLEIDNSQTLDGYADFVHATNPVPPHELQPNRFNPTTVLAAPSPHLGDELPLDQKGWWSPPAHFHPPSQAMSPSHYIRDTPSATVSPSTGKKSLSTPPHSQAVTVSPVGHSI